MKKTAREILNAVKRMYQANSICNTDSYALTVDEALTNLSELVMGEKIKKGIYKNIFNWAVDHIAKLFATDKEESNGNV